MWWSREFHSRWKGGSGQKEHPVVRRWTGCLFKTRVGGRVTCGLRDAGHACWTGGWLSRLWHSFDDWAHLGQIQCSSYIVYILKKIISPDHVGGTGEHEPFLVMFWRLSTGGESFLYPELFPLFEVSGSVISLLFSRFQKEQVLTTKCWGITVVPLNFIS